MPASVRECLRECLREYACFVVRQLVEVSFAFVLAVASSTFVGFHARVRVDVISTGVASSSVETAVEAARVRQTLFSCGN